MFNHHPSSLYTDGQVSNYYLINSIKFCTCLKNFEVYLTIHHTERHAAVFIVANNCKKNINSKGRTKMKFFF